VIRQCIEIVDDQGATVTSRGRDHSTNHDMITRSAGG
jgi:hypothetical protein